MFCADDGGFATGTRRYNGENRKLGGNGRRRLRRELAIEV
jgi:hypothetical protein